VANDVFEKKENKMAFIAVIAIESEFQKYAQSPTGPRGLTQVAKSSFNEGLAKCGVTNVHDDDVWETEINLYAGACYFKNILEMHNNDPYIAIVAYNQGPNSADIKKYSQFGMLNTPEALKYVARFTFLKRTVTSSPKPDTPNITEMPFPVKGNKSL
jgi:soluble lytic murein transglycosylase-like protein